MASISLTDPVAATTVTAGLHAGNNAALRTAINGGLDATNLAAGAAVKGSQLATGITGPPGTQLDYVEFTAPVTIAATTEATSNTIVTGSAVVYDGATAVWIEFGAPRHILAAAASAFIVVTLWDGATDLGVLTAAAGQSLQMPVVAKRRLTPSAASHTYTIKGYRDGGAGTSQISVGAGGIGVDLPGFIRITKA